MTEENKALVRRFYEELNKGNMDIIDELFATNPTYHGPIPSGESGSARTKRGLSEWRSAFPGIEFVIEDQIAEGDKVVSRVSYTGTHKGEFMGLPATGNHFATSAVVIFRITGGKINETWLLRDDLSMLLQLGVVPPLGPAWS